MNNRRRSPRNEAGPHRQEQTDEPIRPEVLYPVRALRKWGLGARGRENLKKAGLKFAQFGRLKFVKGQDLIDVLTRQQGNQE